jgi:hypothetical protein
MNQALYAHMNNKRKMKKKKKVVKSWVLVAHTCNPSFSGGRDQEDRSSKPAPGKQFVRPYLKKNPSQKRTGGMAQGVGPEFKPQYHKKQSRS